MSKIIVRRQEYANNGTHANEIEAVVKQNLIVNTLSSALDVAPSVGLLNSVKSGLESDVDAIENLFNGTKVKLISKKSTASVQIDGLTAYSSLLLAVACSGKGTGVFAIYITNSNPSITKVSGLDNIFTCSYDTATNTLTLTTTDTYGREINVAGICAAT